VEPTRSAPIVIRPMGVGEVIDAGIRLARRNYRLLVVLYAWGLVPAFVFGAISTLVGGGNQQQVLAAIAGKPALAIVFACLGIVVAIAYSLSYFAVLLACSRLILGQSGEDDLRVATLYRLALGRLGAAILLFLIFIVLAAPLAILFPLGIFLVVRWSVSPLVLVVERLGPLASLGRSWQLTRGSWWHTLGVFVVATILVAILEYVVVVIFAGVGAALTLSGSTVVGSIVTSVGNFLVGLFVTPISLALNVVLYYELRARREGFDLAMRAQQTPSV
jgi:hypothetical protein